MCGERVTEYMFGDVNDGCGLQLLSDGSWTNSLTHLIGGENRRREHFSTKQIREVLEPKEICIADTFFNTGYTYYSAQNTGANPDHIAFPLPLLAHVSYLKASTILGRKLQHFKDLTKLRDHVPLVGLLTQTPASAANAADAMLTAKSVRWN